MDRAAHNNSWRFVAAWSFFWNIVQKVVAVFWGCHGQETCCYRLGYRAFIYVTTCLGCLVMTGPICIPPLFVTLLPGAADFEWLPTKEQEYVMPSLHLQDKNSDKKSIHSPIPDHLQPYNKFTLAHMTIYHEFRTSSPVFPQPVELLVEGRVALVGWSRTFWYINACFRCLRTHMWHVVSTLAQLQLPVSTSEATYT